MLKMKATMETEAYVGSNGHFVIRQKDSFDEDAIVLLSYDQAMAMAEYIQANMAELLEAWNNSVEESNDMTPLQKDMFVSVK